MAREAIKIWLSRMMYVVAGVAVVSLILEYGFYLEPGEERVLHVIDIAVVAIFVLDAIVRFALARRRLAHLKRRWPAYAIMGLIVSQLLLVSHLEVRGLLPAFPLW